LGFYNSNTKMLGWSATDLVETANRFAMAVLGELS